MHAYRRRAKRKVRVLPLNIPSWQVRSSAVPRRRHRRPALRTVERSSGAAGDRLPNRCHVTRRLEESSGQGKRRANPAGVAPFGNPQSHGRNRRPIPRSGASVRTREQGLLAVLYAECHRKSGSAQKALFELFGGRCKCHACLQLSLQCDLRKSQNRIMVGTTRFELATSPTPILETTQSK
jgi:hypothetical protein